MCRKICLFLFCLLGGVYSFTENRLLAQNQVLKNCLLLNEALIQKDQKILNELLDSDLSYGHSNGWIESKSELLKNNREGILIYKSISIDTSTIWTQMNRRMAFVRYPMNVEVNLRGKDISLKMHVGQVWKRKGRHWKLVFRQSAKLS